tara:strand:- start:228 stop:794 length:567 start_codon:yes stop_codon:yes gene_type:complete
MARGLSNSVKTELATGVIDPVLLVEIEFSTPVYLTNAPFNITSSVSGSSRTYLTNGHLKNISGVNETNKPTKNSLQLTLSGVDQTYISIALSENIINQEVYIYRGFLDTNNALISDPFLLFFGTIDEYRISDNTDTANLVLNLTSHWGNFQKTSGRVTTDNSQQRFFSGDKGMEFAALSVRDIKWGRD